MGPREHWRKPRGRQARGWGPALVKKMSIVPSLLQAVIHVDGEALVMHAGDKPYVVGSTGQTDLASRGLTLDAVNGIVNQLLPPEFQSALDEFGAVQYELQAMPEFPGEHFTVVAARGGDDVWVEIRRRRAPDEDHVPEEFFAPPPGAPSAPQAAQPAGVAAPPTVASFPHHDDDLVPLELLGETKRAQAVEHLQARAVDEAEAVASVQEFDEANGDDLLLPDATQLWPSETTTSFESEDVAVDADSPAYELTATEEPEYAEPEPEHVEPEYEAPPRVAPVVHDTPPLTPREAPPRVEPLVRDTPPLTPREESPRVPAAPPPPMAAAPPPPVAAPPPPPVAQERAARPLRPAQPPPRAEPPQPAVVLPISRNPIRSDAPASPTVEPPVFGLDRLLRVSAARGASTLYLSSDAQPSVRVDGELQRLDGEAELTARDVESLLLTLMPERSHEALRTGATTEWIVDIEDVGRVRCMSFRDHRGPGGVFRLMPMRTVSVDQLGLPRAIQALAIEPEGLVVVAGPRSSGKRTLMAAYVDLINRSRRDHVITIEREINIVHDRGSSFISQREVRGDDDDLLAAARAALREDPDVLIIEDLRTGALMNVALEASASGRLVIGGFSAHTAAAAIDRIIDLYAPEYRRQVQLALADNLRGVIAQVLLHKMGGGRVAAREVLLNTPAVASVLAEGKTSQLPMAIEGGRRHGMVPLNDSLVGFVQSGAVDSREAYRRSSDRPGFLALLKRQGLDTSFAERLA